MEFCKCLYEIENNLPRTQYCFMPCIAQGRILEKRRKIAEEINKQKNIKNENVDG